MAWSDIQIDLSGVEPLGAPRAKLPEGGLKVMILDSDMVRTKDGTGVNLVIHTVVKGEGEYDGIERSAYLTWPSGQDPEKDEFFKRKIAGLLRSIGIPAENVKSNVRLGPTLFKGKTAYLHVSLKNDDEGRENENLRFISVEDYQRSHWSKRPGAASNGKAAQNQMPALVSAPNISVPPAAGVNVPTSPAATAPVAPAPAGSAPAADLSSFFNQPAR
jgi:hypothetical protein